MVIAITANWWTRHHHFTSVKKKYSCLIQGKCARYPRQCQFRHHGILHRARTNCFLDSQWASFLYLNTLYGILPSPRLGRVDVVRPLGFKDYRGSSLAGVHQPMVNKSVVVCVDRHPCFVTSLWMETAVLHSRWTRLATGPLDVGLAQRNKNCSKKVTDADCESLWEASCAAVTTGEQPSQCLATQENWFFSALQSNSTIYQRRWSAANRNKGVVRVSSQKGAEHDEHSRVVQSLRTPWGKRLNTKRKNSNGTKGTKTTLSHFAACRCLTVSRCAATCGGSPHQYSYGKQSISVEPPSFDTWHIATVSNTKSLDQAGVF